ncbi:envelope stress response membrane protein PspB [Sphingomicrobium astaxanthinifaciens]|uniref:envelope stress response membrane protein PspB n=1 Tax=Sphingomicrobium astaxanthinifaciens TaxID=1227949 RepID=UPI001FCA9C79|nr:envelope stress response membrane protein PspB [Sphingomicrobium astaxanthinifaciens]MCJ7422263.1 envelope stress response membrane protein PspB [Sphingomicrobium astaxanthinifaciens]
MDDFIPFVAIVSIFIGLPWLIFHYVTKWKSQATLTAPDEKLLEELHEAARRLDDRICTIERIMSAEDPQWREKCVSADRLRDQNLLGRADQLLAEHEALLDRKKEH